MKVYYLEKNRQDKLIDTDDGRYLVRFYGTFKIEHTIIIDNSSIDSMDIQQFKSDSESDNPELESFGWKFIDTGNRIYLFWYSDYQSNKSFY